MMDARVLEIIAWETEGLLVSPKGRLLNWYFRKFKVNAVNSFDSSDKGTWWKALRKSKDVKILAPLNPYNISSIRGRG